MQTIERLIVTELLKDMRAAGYQPAAVWDGEEYVMADNRTVAVKPRMFSFQPTQPTEDSTMRRPMTDDEALAAIDSVDECTLHFTDHNETTWGGRGVLLILGNGEDIISDYHVAKGERFGEIIDAICNRLTSGATSDTTRRPPVGV